MVMIYGNNTIIINIANVFLILCNIKTSLPYVIIWKACKFYYISSENDVHDDGDNGDGVRCSGVRGGGVRDGGDHDDFDYALGA
jgi:hypothetical protein